MGNTARLSVSRHRAAGTQAGGRAPDHAAAVRRRALLLGAALGLVGAPLVQTSSVQALPSTGRSLLSAMIFGVIPALRTAKPNLMETLRAVGRSGALGAASLRNGVVVVEVALAFVLLIGSGLMFRTFLNIQRVNLGFNPRGILTFQLLGNVGATPQERDNFKRQLREQLGACEQCDSVKSIAARGRV